MSSLLRMTYGHGGTRGRRILVAVPAAEPATPQWLKIIFLAAWLVVPLFICRFSLPTLTHTSTVIDTSRLTVQPRQEPVPAPKPLIEPPPHPIPIAVAPKPLAVPSPRTPQPPTITRQPRSLDQADPQPRLARQRLQPGEDMPGAPAMRIRRDAAIPETSAVRTTIARTRGGAVAPLPTAERTTALRRVAAAEEPTATAPTRSISRRKPAEMSGTEDMRASRVAAARDRRAIAETGEEEVSKGGVGLSRGISLASLEICSSPQAEEDAIKAVLAAVGSRQTCRDETGEYQFRATKRVSSFNLLIRPAKGRRPTNRCEELEHAYSCLKTH